MLETRSFTLPVAAALGPAALGAVLGAQISPVVALREAALVPAIIVGLTAATVPALYIATVATGSRLTARGLARSVARGLEGLGVVLLGLVGPIAFVVATTRLIEVGVVVGMVAVGVAATLGLRRMRAAMIEDDTVATGIDGWLFLAWAVIAAVLGARLLLGVMEVA
jgi:hypothetical protein